MFDPVGRTDDFEFDLLLSEVRLPALNDLAREYAAVDFESGHGELVMELEEEFDINIPDDAAEKIQTVGQAVQYIESGTNGKS